jgi:hypothetical protein
VARISVEEDPEDGDQYLVLDVLAEGDESESFNAHKSYTALGSAQRRPPIISSTPGLRCDLSVRAVMAVLFWVESEQLGSGAGHRRNVGGSARMAFSHD